MNTYVTGTTIRHLRELRNFTQAELADRIGVSSKTISKWETGKGLPDISLLQPLAQALGISVIELMNGEHITNKNVSANLLRSKFYVCPLCGNSVHTLGNTLVSCCGITLPPLEAEEADSSHSVSIENVEDEHFITVHHPMTKAHYISFLAYVTTDRIQLVKLYPEGNAQTRLQLRGLGRSTGTATGTDCSAKGFECTRNTATYTVCTHSPSGGEHLRANTQDPPSACTQLGTQFRKHFTFMQYHGILIANRKEGYL